MGNASPSSSAFFPFLCSWLYYLIFFLIFCFQAEKYLTEKLDVYESAVGDSTAKSAVYIDVFPPAFQKIPRNPIVLDLAYNFVEFPSLDNRMKKDKKGFISRLWRWVPSTGFGFNWVLLKYTKIKGIFVPESMHFSHLDWLVLTVLFNLFYKFWDCS